VGPDGGSDAVLADAFIDAVRELSASIAIPETFAEIEPADVPVIAAAAIAEGFELHAVPKYMRQAEAEAVVRALIG
jgi:alcohol dehydrogenase class IV